MKSQNLLSSAEKKLTEMLYTAKTVEEADRIVGRILDVHDRQGKEEPRLWSLEEASAYASIAPHTLRQWCSMEKAPYLKINGAVRFDPVGFKRWCIQESAVKPHSVWRKR